MRQMPIDTETHRQATKVLALAKRRGQDPVEALYRAGFLATPAGDKDLQVQGMEGVLSHLVTYRVSDLLRMRFKDRLSGRTNQDVYDSVIAWLINYVREFREP